MAFRISTVD